MWASWIFALTEREPFLEVAVALCWMLSFLHMYTWQLFVCHCSLQLLTTSNKKRKGLRHSKSQPIVHKVQPHPHRGAKKKWTNEQMKAAMKCVRDDNLSANWAADLHRVLRSRLEDHLSGRIIDRTNPAPKPYLTADESWLKCMSRRWVHWEVLPFAVDGGTSNAKLSYRWCDCWSKNGCH